LLANAVDQSTFELTDTLPSRASPLPHLINGIATKALRQLSTAAPIFRPLRRRDTISPAAITSKLRIPVAMIST